MLKKLFLVPWFGDFPPWFEQYKANIAPLKELGYDWLFFTDREMFVNRVKKRLDLDINLQPGTSKSHDLRSAFGVLFKDELKGYDYWGITDLDCVYGRVDQFVSDRDLEPLDIWSNHVDYICGPWTLFKHRTKVNTMFARVPGWRDFMQHDTDHPGRWTEQEFTRQVDHEHATGLIRRRYTHFQGKDPNIKENLAYNDGVLKDGDDEIMMFHFNRFKEWPL